MASWMNLNKPILLCPNNFTPRQRTPWASRIIAQDYKEHLIKDEDGDQQFVGESWEFSCDEQFPSLIADSTIYLKELIEQHPEDILSPEFIHITGKKECHLLVKLISTASPLSVQLHPPDHWSQLTAKQSGKPESWLILKTEKNAGIYLGFKRRFRHEDLKKLLSSKTNIADELHFIPVHANQYFEIHPGIPHAIGAGITLLEPQKVLFGKTGVTYRMWDWGRKYNSHGIIDDQGLPRQLHVDQCLSLIDPEKTGQEIHEEAEKKPMHSLLKVGVECWQFPANAYCQVSRFDLLKDGCLQLSLNMGFAVLIILEGEIEISQQHKTESTSISKGQPALLPWKIFPMHIKAKEKSNFCLIAPTLSQFRFE